MGPLGVPTLPRQRTNLILQSQVLGTTWTTASAAVTSDAIAAPDGTTTGDRLVEAAATAAHELFQQITKAAEPIAYTASIWAQAGGRSTFRILMEGSATGNAACTFDISAGAVGAAAISGSFAAPVGTIRNYGGGWYRCALTATSNADAGLFFTLLLGTGSYAGDGSSGIYFWGAQLEAGNQPSLYIPTTTVAVSRTSA